MSEVTDLDVDYLKKELLDLIEDDIRKTGKPGDYVVSDTGYRIAAEDEFERLVEQGFIGVGVEPYWYGPTGAQGLTGVQGVIGVQRTIGTQGTVGVGYFIGSK